MTLLNQCDGCKEHPHPDDMLIVRRAFEELALCPACAEDYQREHPDATAQPYRAPVLAGQPSLFGGTA